jgi:hypothetical protein
MAVGTTAVHCEKIAFLTGFLLLRRNGGKGLHRVDNFHVSIGRTKCCRNPFGDLGSEVIQPEG